MRGSTLWFRVPAFSIVMWASVAPARPAQHDVPAGKEEELVTVQGCVHGSHFKIAKSLRTDAAAELLRASEYVLEGKRELLQRIRKAHDGHLEEITGIVKLPPTPQNPKVAVRTKKVGKRARVTIGARSEPALVEAAPQPVRITVESFRHINDRCSVAVQ